MNTIDTINTIIHKLDEGKWTNGKWRHHICHRLPIIDSINDHLSIPKSMICAISYINQYAEDGRIESTTTNEMNDATMTTSATEHANSCAYFFGSSAFFSSAFLSSLAPVDKISLIFSKGWPLIKEATLAQPKWSKDLISM